ncbi:MAG: hypothetical protein IH626_05365 [Rhodospirillales bacterium]|nr:hypothetical protein [Rhodospirillales bacterium]
MFARVLIAQHSWLPATVREMDLTDFVEAVVATDEFNREMAKILDGGG